MVAGPLPKNSRFWWVKFSVRGKVFQETANTESKNEALKFLSRRKDEEATGKAVDCEKVTVAMLAEKMMDMWKRDERKESTREWAAYCWMHLLPYFGRMKAADALLTASIEAYQDRRKAEGASNGTANRELTVLSCAFTIGYMNKPRLVPAKLSFTRLPEPKGRQGFVEEAQYRALAANCPELYMRPMLALTYSFGFRKAELLTLQVSDVDIMAGTIRLRTSKNGEPRQVNLTAETRGLLAACIAGKSPEDAVFTRGRVPVADFRGTWGAVTKSAGCEGLLFHDLRRSAVRNMIGAGIPEGVCMKISGHKTRAVFDRYNIVSEKDLTDAAKKIEKAASSDRTVTAEEIDEKPEAVQNETIQ